MLLIRLDVHWEQDYIPDCLVRGAATIPSNERGCRGFFLPSEGKEINGTIA